MTTTIDRPTIDETAADPTSDEAFAERVFGSVLGAYEIFAIYLGDRLGYYEALAQHGPLSSDELAEIVGTVERYTREWLEQQAVSGIVTVTHDGAIRRFGLPDGHAISLTHRTHLSYMAPLARMVTAAGMQLRGVVDAHRSGGGVPWEAFGDDMREAQGDANRPFFANDLGPGLANVEAIADRLGSGARVADVGAGHGWSAIAIADHFPGVTVDGFDIDEPSVEVARRHAAEAGVADRVRFQAVDAGSPDVDGDYDLVTAFECIHDMPDPVSVLTTMRRLAGDGGAVVVMDERVADDFDPDAGELEQLMYGFSNFICLPDGMSAPGSVGTGTVMRPSTLLAYAREAGFEAIDVLDIESPMWTFYRLR